MPTLYNYADGGTNTTAVTAANSGGASGTAMDTGGSGGTLTFSNTVVANGSLSYLITPSAGTSSWFIMYRNAGGTANTLTFPGLTMFCSGVFYFSTAVPTIGRMMEYVNSGFSHTAGVGVNASQKLTLVNAAGTVVNTSTTTLPANAQFRVELWVKSDAAAGQIIAKIYLNKNSIVPTEVITSATNLNTRGGNITAAIWGYPTTTTTSNPMYMDSLIVSSDSWEAVGPLAASRTNFLMF